MSSPIPVPRRPAARALRFALAVVAGSLLVLAPAVAGLAVAGPPDDTGTYVLPGEPGRTSRETLPDVAERTLGDRDRWPEILVLNRGRVQPDGRALTNRDDPLQAGWSLMLPEGARSGETQLEPTRETGRAAPPQIVTVPSVVIPVPSRVDPAPPPVVPVPVVPAPAVAGASGTLLGLSPVVWVTGGAALLLGLFAAAAVLLLRRRGTSASPRRGLLESAAGLLRRRRRPAPPPWVGGDEYSRERAVLDRALNQLPPAARPMVFAAVVGPDRVSLRLTPAVPEAPPPWQAREQGAVWEAPNWQLDAAPAAPEAHPFPLLAPVGTIGGEWTAVDLGRAPGLIAFTGEPGDAERASGAVLAAVGSDPRAAAIAITVVGPVPRAGLDLRRLQVAASLQDLPGVLTPHPVAPDVTGMLDNIWGEGPAAGQLNRHLVVVTAPLASAELELLAAAAARSDNTAAVMLVGDHPNAVWRFGARADGTLDVGVLGLHLDEAPTRAGAGDRR